MARKSNGFGDTEAIRHPIESIDIYEVTRDEIEQLSKSNISDLFLEFAIALLSICASFFCSMLVADFDTSPRAYICFLLITIITFLGGIICGSIWYRKRKGKDEVVQKILERKAK